MPELNLSTGTDHSALRNSQDAGSGPETGSAIPPAATGPVKLQDIRTTDAPRVDEALQTILDHRNDPYIETREQVAAIGEEVRSLGYRGSDAVANIRGRIREQPLQAIGIAALAGFVYGMVR